MEGINREMLGYKQKLLAFNDRLVSEKPGVLLDDLQHVVSGDRGIKATGVVVKGPHGVVTASSNMSK